MPRVVQREYTFTVNTFSELFSLTNLSDNMDITVLDASGDIRTSGGTVVYVYLSNKTGVDAFLPIASELEDFLVVEQESLPIIDGVATLSYTPANGVLLSVQARWINEQSFEIVEDVIYTISDGVHVNVDSYYNDKNLIVKYVRNNSGKIVSTISDQGFLHTHNNKEYLDTITSLKTVNNQDLRGSGNIVISGGTVGNGLQIDINGATEIDENIVATKSDLLLVYTKSEVDAIIAPLEQRISDLEETLIEIANQLNS